MVSRRGVLGGLFAGATLPLLTAAGGALAEGPAPVLRPRPRPAGGLGPEAQLSRLIEAAKLGGTVSYVVADALTGAVLAGRAADHPQPPASVLKAMTAVYALERLGPAFRYDTRVIATGPVQGGIVQGDLILAGAGDPTLQTDQLGDLVADLAKAGLKGITGRFLIWSGALPALPEIAADQPDHVGYNPAIAGLNLNFNRVHFEWRRAQGDWTLAMDARGERFVPQVRLARMRIADRKVPLFTYANADGREDWTVASAALGKGGARWLPVRHPALYTAEVFQTLARAQGITLPDVQPVEVLPAGGVVLGRLASAALPEILRDMLRHSTNLTAEAVGLRSTGAADLPASGAAMTAWAAQRMGLSGHFVDHSGLGNASRITAADMVRALVWANRSGGALKPLLRDYPMRDDKGDEVKGNTVAIRAKSGTLNFVSGLAGHIAPPQGRELVFAIFCADPDRRARLTEAEREEPPGGRDWVRRARRLQGQLINRWAATYA